MGDDSRGAGVLAARGRVGVVLASLLAGMGSARSWQVAPGDGTLWPVVLFVLAAVLSLAAMRFASRPWIVATLLCLGVAVFGAAWWPVRTRPVPGSLTDVLLATPQGASVTMRGRVLDRPSSTNPNRGALWASMPYTPSARFRVEIHSILTDSGWSAATGRLRVRVMGVDGVDRSTVGPGPGAAGAGDVVVLTGRASAYDAPDIPDEPDPSAWAAQEGLAGWMVVPSPAMVEVIPRGSDTPAGRAWAAWIRSREWLTHAAVRSLSPTAVASVTATPSVESVRRQEARALVLSLVLGLDEFRQDQVRERFTRLGVVHVLAISGYHVAVLAGLVGLGARAVGGYGRWESLAVGTAVVAYTVVAPASAPVLRACVCLLALLAARWSGRRYDAVCVLLWAGTALAVWKPVEAFSLGYMLSFGVCTLLLTSSGRFHRAVAGTGLRGLSPRRRSVARAALGTAGRYLTASALCWAGSAAVIAWWTGWFSPAAMVSSVVVVPAVSALLAGGMFTVVAGVACHLVSPVAADAVCGPMSALLDGYAAWILRVIDSIDSAPGGWWRVPPLPGAWCVLATAAMIGLLAGSRGWRRFGAVAWVALLAWLALESGRTWQRHGLVPDSAMRADVLSVGDGLCAAVRVKGRDGTVESVLFGAGASRPGLGIRAVPAALRLLGAWRIETAVVLGDSPGQFVMLPDLVRPLGIRRALVPRSLLERATDDPAGIQAALVRLLDDLGVEVLAIGNGDALRLRNGSRVRFDVADGRRGANAAVEVEGDRAAGPALVVSLDPSHVPRHARVVLAAGSAATDAGVARLRGETSAAVIVVSRSEASRTAREEESVVVRTGRQGTIFVTWNREGTPSVASHRPDRS